MPQVLCWHVQAVFTLQQSQVTVARFISYNNTVPIIAPSGTVQLSKPIIKLHHQVKSINIW